MNRIELGKWGEEKAAVFLGDQGYFIIERNFRCRFGEIDIVSIKDEFLCFVEVKTRSSIGYGLPCEAVNDRKQRHIKNVAHYYILSHPEYAALSPRNDIVEILSLSEGNYIRLLSAAF